MRSMPSTDVSVALKTAWHRNRDKPWSANDVYDIDALALAVPCCDIVVTEKACHHTLVSTGMDVRMNTVLLRDLPSHQAHVRLACGEGINAAPHTIGRFSHAEGDLSAWPWN